MLSKETIIAAHEDFLKWCEEKYGKGFDPMYESHAKFNECLEAYDQTKRVLPIIQIGMMEK